MKKRLLSFLLALASVTSLVACSVGGDGTDTGTGTGTEIDSSADTTDNEKEEDITEMIEYTTKNLSEYTVPEWYRDAKFGIFIHYGVYSVPAFGDEWYGHWMYMEGSRSYGNSDIYSHHLSKYKGASKFGYKDFIPAFETALQTYKENNMAKEWVELFAAAGAKYVMPVGIHHDSYALYDSDIQTTYNSVNGAGVDYVGDLQKAVTSLGMKFGISNHFAENDWFFSDAHGAGTDLAEKNADGTLVYGELYGDGKDKSSEHIHKWYDISMEIINKYHPDLIYYDFDLVGEAFNRYSDANRYLMLAEYYNQAQTHNPDGVICCNKNGAFTTSEAILNKERSSLSAISAVPWQADTSIGLKSWCYTEDDIYRSGDEFIGALVDIVSKNGNLLLNVGPRADGTIPDEARDALLTIGKWLSTYGDAIYATRPWLVYGEGSTSNTGDSFTYKYTDIRFTRSKDASTLYATALAKPRRSEMVIKTLKSGSWDASTLKSVSLINGSERTPLSWKQTEKGLEVSLPDGIDGPHSVELKFTDNTIPPVALDASAENLAINYHKAENVTHGESAADGGETVVANDGAYTVNRISFGDKRYGSINMTVLGKSEGTITVSDNKTGEVIATVTVSSSLLKNDRTVSASLTGTLSGDVDLKLEFTGNIELSTYRFVEKRIVGEVIDASVFDGKNGTVQAEATSDPEGGGNSLGYVGAGNWVLYRGVDFGDGCKQLFVRAGGANKQFKVYIDKIAESNLIASGTVTTSGYNDYKTMSVPIENVTGEHDVYFVFVGDAINLNWLLFSEEEYDDPNDHDSEPRPVGVKIEAETFDEKHGTVIAENIADGSVGMNLGYVSAGDWVSYTHTVLDGAASVTARLAGMGGTVELRLDSPTGELIASFEKINTGAWASYKEFTCDLPLVSGEHTVYIVFKVSASNVDWIRFD